MDESKFLLQNERVIFIVLAVIVWAFIIHTVYSSFMTRRELQRQIDSLPRVPEGEQPEAIKEGETKKNK